MSTVRIREKKIFVDDKSIPLLSGEVHYWRLAPEQWSPVLKRVKQMGLPVVATYVPWDFHELEPGGYDFTGETDPRRDLLGFLELLTEMDFWIFLRPGPYIYSEWRNRGVPDRAVKLHRLDPAFRAMAEEYMQEIAEAALPYLATKGGKIVLWQADNEIDPWPHHYTEELGLGRTPGPFHEFLRKRYGDVEALNEAWGTAYISLEEAKAVSRFDPNHPDFAPQQSDFLRFKHWYVNRVASWVVAKYRSLGVDVPMVLNTYSGVSTQHWAEMEKIGDLVGPDIYPSHQFRYRDHEHRNFLDMMRYSRTYSRLPHITEFESGIWHDWLSDVGALSPRHYRLMCVSALMGGIAGWNWYMLVNRDNWYQSPINEWGRTRPALFEVYKEMVDLYQTIDPTTLVKQTSTAVTYDPLQRGTQRPGQRLLESLYMADIDYEFFDLSQDKGTKPLLFYAGGFWLSKDSQARLVTYVNNGGHVVFVGNYPRYDEHLEPLNLLEVQPPLGIISGEPGRMKLSIFKDCVVQGEWFYQYEQVPGKPIELVRLGPEENPKEEELLLQSSLQVGQRYIAGYTERRGDGRITVLGLPSSPQLLTALHGQFALPIPCRARIQCVQTALFRRQEVLYLFATNLGDEEKFVQVQLSPSMLDSFSNLSGDTLVHEGRDVQIQHKTVSFKVDGKDACVIKITSS